jgi:SnoaL-like domain
MSQENVGVVRRLIEAWNRHDAEMAVSHLRSDIEWSAAGPAAVERTIYHARDECARGSAAVWETWDEFRFEESEVRDLGHTVLWLGQLVRVRAILGWREGLEALGLSE